MIKLNEAPDIALNAFSAFKRENTKRTKLGLFGAIVCCPFTSGASCAYYIRALYYDDCYDSNCVGKNKSFIEEPVDLKAANFLNEIQEQLQDLKIKPKNLINCSDNVRAEIVTNQVESSKELLLEAIEKLQKIYRSGFRLKFYTEKFKEALDKIEELIKIDQKVNEINANADAPPDYEEVSEFSFSL